MPTAPNQSIPVSKSVVVEVADYAADGETLDTTEALALAATPSGLVTAAVEPGNNRYIRITGVAQGSGGVTVSAPGVNSDGALTIPFTVTPAPNLSRIDFVSATPPA